MIYLAICTRPDISYAVSYLSRFSANPGVPHWKAVKRIFRYLKGTIDLQLVYGPELGPEIFTAYSDSDYGGSVDTGKSTGGYAITVGHGAVSWSSKLQPLVTLSTTQAEYVAAVEAGKEILWFRNILFEFGYDVSAPSTLYLDNQSAIRVSKNPEHHGRMKHMDIRYFWLRDEVDLGRIKVDYIPSREMVADIFTKALPKESFEILRAKLGLYNNLIK